jgi:hypothetical protein
MQKLFLHHNILPVAILLLLVCIGSSDANGQEDWYTNAIRSNIQKLNSTNSTEGLKQISQFFYRAWETNPDDWIPAYYYIFTLVKSVEDSSCSDRSKLITIADEFEKKHCKRFIQINEFEILKAKVDLLQFRFLNDTTALNESKSHLSSVLKRDKNNIRWKLVMSQYLLSKYTDSMFERRQAENYLKSVITQRDQHISNHSFLPVWGKKEAELLLKEIK